ncbi:hypothetical protein Strain138_000482 [Pseudogemmatithrix spongiicola]|uniref:KTSC domain-containing protein n=1 Tax=Pseudogemmatithrix spongiicola TaxID=3062599 RepID=A0AA49Q3U5_9BACT|nr:hypothetical protein Strain138_000482 [Gemmatimonadaceae bacterium 'strain 138']WKW14156.1 hypothetical protein Strain318_000482 [Gemmatimonadaceae bacterium 'strain 318']
MKRYADVDNDSGVFAYEYGPGWIHVQFDTGAAYEYTDASAGAHHIREMQRRADAGDGLNAYIMKHARKGYSRKL